MAAIIRVKRRIDEEPLNAFVLDCKKRKCDDLGQTAASSVATTIGSNEETSTTIVKFAGTVANQDDIATHMTKLTKADAINATNRVRPLTNLTSRNRDELRQQAQDNRFKIVNCYRTLDGDSTCDSIVGSSSSNSLNGIQSQSSATQNITVVDIERHSTADIALESTAAVTATGQTSSADDTHNYVYDLYLPDASQSTDLDYDLVDNLLSIRPLDDLTFGTARDNGLRDSSDESEDSNDENNWRNEYPDTEEEGNDDGDDNSVDENDMRRAFNSMDMDDERQLSSDDDQTAYKNGFVYSIDSESIGFEDDIDYCDVNRYGEAYARYKARIIKKKAADSEDDDEYDQELSDDYQSD